MLPITLFLAGDAAFIMLAITLLLYLVTLIVFVSDSKVRQSVQSEGQQYFSVNNTNLPNGGLKDDILDIGLNAGPFIGIIVFDSLIMYELDFFHVQHTAFPQIVTFKKLILCDIARQIVDVSFDVYGQCGKSQS